MPPDARGGPELPIHTGATPNAWGIWYPDDPRQIPWTRYLDEVREVGYTWTELGAYGYLPTHPERLRHELDQRDLRLLGGYIAGYLEDAGAAAALGDQLIALGDLVADVGGRFLILFGDSYRGSFAADGGPVRTRRLAEDAWRRLVETTSELGALIAERFGGELELAFHPHADTAVEYPEDLERLLADTDAGTVKVCMDVAHYAYRGGDPVAFMKRHHARTPYLHLKDLHPVVTEEVNAIDLPLYPAITSGVFEEAGRGCLDLVAFADVLRNVGWTGYAGVEHDMFPADPRSVLLAEKRTRSYLRSIGLA
jgi:inosose dehydratase